MKELPSQLWRNGGDKEPELMIANVIPSQASVYRESSKLNYQTPSVYK